MKQLTPIWIMKIIRNVERETSANKEYLAQKFFTINMIMKEKFSRPKFISVTLQ
jgi:G:T-mismatch repair DNA endonuclease (very short patch repair protein)